MLLISVNFFLVAKIRIIYETTKFKFKNNTRTIRKKHVSLRERQVSITNYKLQFYFCQLIQEKNKIVLQCCSAAVKKHGLQIDES